MARVSRGNGAAAATAAAPSMALMRAPAKGDISLAFGRGDRGGRPPLGDLPLYVSADEVRRAIKHADATTAALLAFLWGTGVRITEALALTPQDIDVDRRTARVPTLKRRRKDGTGRKTSPARVVAVAGHWINPVLGYIVTARTGPQARVFPFGRQHAWRRISIALRAVGVDAGRAKPHALRHGHAVHAVQHGVALNVIQRQLGHASIVTTAIYLAVTVQDVRSAYDQFDW